MILQNKTEKDIHLKNILYNIMYSYIKHLIYILGTFPINVLRGIQYITE